MWAYRGGLEPFYCVQAGPEGQGGSTYKHHSRGRQLVHREEASCKGSQPIHATLRQPGSSPLGCGLRGSRRSPDAYSPQPFASE